MEGGLAMPSAADWLVDNFYVVMAQIRDVRHGLPNSYYRSLPSLKEGPLAGKPRVLNLAWAFVARGDSSFDPELLRRFVAAFQEIEPLAMGELWALPSFLRLVLIENLRRESARLAHILEERRRADQLADTLLGLAGPRNAGPSRALEPYQGRILPPAFTVQLFQRLREQDPRVRPAVQWLEERLAAQQSSGEDMVARQHAEEVARNATVRNVITSMRLISDFEWSGFFESVNLVDRTLAEGSNFTQVSFPTRDRYRHALEDLAKRSRVGEVQAAQAVMKACAEAAERKRGRGGETGRRDEDPGYYLIAQGRWALEKRIGFSPSLRSLALRALSAVAVPGYLGGAALLTAAWLSLPLAWTYWHGASAVGTAVLAVLALVPASEAALALINRLATRLLEPRHLPRLELQQGIPSEFRTAVAIPILLTTEADLAEAVNRLEVHYLSNGEGDLVFALLSDWVDSETEVRPEDQALLESARRNIARLNQEHGLAPGGWERFHLCHRTRRWNPSERKWMGWERKRGKLHEFNRLLRGADDTSFLPPGEGPGRLPSGVRFVLTLDVDTRMPIGTAKGLIGTLAHPLNQPVFDPVSGRVVQGYGVLQPRVTHTLPSQDRRTLYQMVFSGPAGTDPYASAASDVYQDLFGEGSYTGKGLYEVDAFEASLARRVPENHLLSHDLFEGLFARAGLATDLEVFEDFPSHVQASVNRQQRWTRGDWQLLPWIFGNGPRSAVQGPRARIPVLARWKMLDNLRRSLLAPACVATLACAWLLPQVRTGVWETFIMACLAFPSVLTMLAMDWMPHRSGVSKRNHLRRIGADLALAAGQLFFQTCLLAQQAWWMAEAIARTLFRMTFSRRRLLEWVPDSLARRGLARDWMEFYGALPQGLWLAAGLLTLETLTHPHTWAYATPYMGLWMAGPLVAAWYSFWRAGPAALAPNVPPQEAQSLRLVARRTWFFFQTFATEKENHLPPDNYQEDPRPLVANRTSPTNIGLYLLSALSARDFGWAGKQALAARLERVFTTMDKLERFRGHWLNWYDTRTLKPLLPRYVSSVDSGNLAGDLLTLRQACLEILHQPAFEPARLRGMAQTLALAREAAAPHLPGRSSQILAVGALAGTLDGMETLLDALVPGTALGPRLRRFKEEAETLADMAKAVVEESGLKDSPFLDWAEALRQEATEHWEDFVQLGGEGSDGAAALERSPGAACADLAVRFHRLAERCGRDFEGMDFRFLYDEPRQLLSIGFDVDLQKLDQGCYDLMASEARLASFLAVAKGELPPRHWFRLSRPLAPVGRGAALLSWSGSMFEYLMPTLVLHAPSGSLLDETGRLVVKRQMEYGASLGLPWGFSESAFFARDAEMNFQYANFGVPDLGLKRGLALERVVAPYASGLAAMLAPAEAAANLDLLARMGGAGLYGFYDAVDFTPGRIPQGASFAVVRNYMAHHQGMMLVALDNVLLRGRMQSRFHSHPLVAAAELLLQERVPRSVPVTRPVEEPLTAGMGRHELPPAVQRRFFSAHDSLPQTHLLSNGHYSVLVTSAGSGYSRLGRLALTRWREDAASDAWGQYVFLRDTGTGRLWSPGFHPTGVEADSYRALFLEDKAEFSRRDGPYTTQLDVMVNPEEDAELRRLTLTFSGSRPVEVEITTYAELVLAPPEADEAHPAFSKLFVQTEFASEAGVLLANRRSRQSGEQTLWLGQTLTLDGEGAGGLQVETDRARFLGRGQPLSRAAAMDGRLLSGTTGAVLDPIFSLRRRVRLNPGGTARLTLVTLAADNRETALKMMEKYRNPLLAERVEALAWTKAQVELRHLRITPEEADLFQGLANHLLYANAGLRPAPDTLLRPGAGVRGLWQHGISGDLPIVLLRLDEMADRDLFRQLLRAHQYWRMKGLEADLVVLNDEPPTYAAEFQHALEDMLKMAQPSPSAPAGPAEAKRGAVFILPAHTLSPEYQDLLRCLARVVLLSRQGTLAEQVARTQALPGVPPPPLPAVSVGRREGGPQKLELEAFNGLGGFADQGREYVIQLGEGQWTPAPWSNVVSNPSFGFLATESGSGYTWAENSRENKLTPWSNDPVSDPPGEAVYLRDEETGELWTPTALPIRLPQATYTCRHGQGYSRFEHSSRGMAASLTWFVPSNDPLKVGWLKLRNLGSRPRTLSVTAYAEWVMGVSRAQSGPYIQSSMDGPSRALFFRNAGSGEFQGRVAFLHLAGGEAMGWTGDRVEFIGRNGNLERPMGLSQGRLLSRRTGPALDPCGAFQLKIEVPAGQEVEVRILMGQAKGEAQARDLIGRWRTADLKAELGRVGRFWDHLLGNVKIRTPDRSLDLLFNRWLLYQTLSCRLWARSAFYQCGGAFGFRDQLQDVMALLWARPGLAREQILLAAEKQFPQGDAMHWWHPPSGRGVRTHISDDRLWLPWAVAHYVRVTGDARVLDREVGFVEGPTVAAGHDDYYFQPGLADHAASLYEHCVRALERSLETGPHGLPLMGSGDWNDGMNRVGAGGKGESVWLAWFLADTLESFAVLGEGRKDARAAAWREKASALAKAAEEAAWDGDWYRRAYDDAGTPLGSAASMECRIDSIAQSWAVLSGRAQPDRIRRAMQAVEEYLLHRGSNLCLLFTPPFDRGPQEPGYVKGYPPGVRENGGQYSHAAAWVAAAFAGLGDGRKAWEVLGTLNPVRHSATRAGAHRYKTEPYVIAADIYAEPPHAGRGGWTWYTGSAGWMYRVVLEWLLGLKVAQGKAWLDPCIPPEWPGFELSCRYFETVYEISVSNPRQVSRGVVGSELDGQRVPAGGPIDLVRDGKVHVVKVEMG
jgi:cyclic beta-1,2-glucan synthetase